MSDLLEVHGGGVAISDRSVPELVSAIITIIDNYDFYYKKAYSAAQHWRGIHTAKIMLHIS